MVKKNLEDGLPGLVYKWLGLITPFISYEWPFGKGSHNPILRGQQRSPWLLTTDPHWEPILQVWQQHIHLRGGWWGAWLVVGKVLKGGGGKDVEKKDGLNNAQRVYT